MCPPQRRGDRPVRGRRISTTFNFFGFTTIYSCNGLEDKLKRLLRLIGAGPDAKVIGSCSAGIGVPDKLALAYLTFSSLQPVGGSASGSRRGRH